ncbi:hypothetical protein O181_017720 [Austropuccinia psidii MF-1]|uniref:Uncharacterized protein n=1 Tax=Austropuccinia psidii MF-1 TaxID=1389203 RepID=A0A9Q3C8D2_9BASI|nr:hypothetical protein [Austropuccinia psidii MF-1]
MTFPCHLIISPLYHAYSHECAKICFHSHQHTSAITPPYASTTLPNPLCHTLIIFLQRRHGISSLTHPYASAPPPQPHDMPLMPPPLLMLPHHRLIFSTAYHAHTPSPLSQYASNYATPCLPSPILMLPHPRKICLRHCHPMSALTHPYALTPLPHLLHSLPCLHSHIRSIG